MTIQRTRNCWEMQLLKLTRQRRLKWYSNGREAVQYLEECFDENLPCAIILDYSMPQLNGAEVLAILHKNPRFNAIPKFVWSTSNSKVHIDECKQNGALNYFIKPDQPDKLYRLVKEVLAACD